MAALMFSTHFFNLCPAIWHICDLISSITFCRESCLVRWCSELRASSSPDRSSSAVETMSNWCPSCSLQTQYTTEQAQKTLWRKVSSAVLLYKKPPVCVSGRLSPPLGDLEAMYAVHRRYWKDRGVLPISHNWTFFQLDITAEAQQANID